MKINITGRHLEVTPALKDYIERKSEKIKYFFEHVLDVHVILQVLKNLHKIEITLNSEGKTFYCEADSTDMYSSIDLAFDKLERQVKKFKEKIMNHKAVTGTALNFLKKRSSSEENVRITKIKEVQPKPMTWQEAILSLSMNSHNFEIFNEDKKKDKEAVALKKTDSLYEIIEKEDGKWVIKEYKKQKEKLKLSKTNEISIPELSQMEAINTLLEDDLDHLIFYDNELKNLNVLYVRKNKTLGLITS